jgi:hypothetical protein
VSVALLAALFARSALSAPPLKDVYTGVATLDKNGEAVIQLPADFDARYTDVRYQVQGFKDAMPALYISDEEHENHFGIAGGNANGEISWQITAERR